jgi:hypothetical protein
MTQRLTFLSHFIIVLACAGGAFFAWRAGALQAVYASDKSMMTSVIAVLLIGTAIHLGRQAWLIDSPARYMGLDSSGRRIDGSPHVESEDGHEAQELVVMAGLFGTALGLSLQATALMSGSASFGALATALYTTACGVGASAIIKIMTRNLEKGMRRAGR